MIMDLLKTAKFALDGIEVSTESTILKNMLEVSLE
jgi:hypothetical protein